VQPRHGAFPELLSAGGGTLYEPGSAAELAKSLEMMMVSPENRVATAKIGQQQVRTRYDDRSLARATVEIFAMKS
ncbi:MAG: glycosyltransferase family 1 protein, partial [Planctomycetaceae bacterium]